MCAGRGGRRASRASSPRRWAAARAWNSTSSPLCTSSVGCRRIRKAASAAMASGQQRDCDDQRPAAPARRLEMNIAARRVEAPPAAPCRFRARRAKQGSANKLGSRPVSLDHSTCASARSCCCSGVPLLLMGALIVGLRSAQDELERGVAPTPTTSARPTPGGAGSGERRRAGPAQAHRRLRRAPLRDRAARRQAAGVRGRAGRHGSGCC